MDIVGVDFFYPGALDSLVEPREQLREGLIWPTPQHGKGVVTIGGHCHTAHGIEYAHGDFAIGYIRAAILIIGCLRLFV